jgi:hypothetical protein
VIGMSLPLKLVCRFRAEATPKGSRHSFTDTEDQVVRIRNCHEIWQVVEYITVWMVKYFWTTLPQMKCLCAIYLSSDNSVQLPCRYYSYRKLLAQSLHLKLSFILVVSDRTTLSSSYPAGLLHSSLWYHFSLSNWPLKFIHSNGGHILAV